MLEKLTRKLILIPDLPVTFIFIWAYFLVLLVYGILILVFGKSVSTSSILMFLTSPFNFAESANPAYGSPLIGELYNFVLVIIEIAFYESLERIYYWVYNKPSYFINKFKSYFPTWFVFTLAVLSSYIILSLNWFNSASIPNGTSIIAFTFMILIFIISTLVLIELIVLIIFQNKKINYTAITLFLLISFLSFYSLNFYLSNKLHWEGLTVFILLSAYALTTRYYSKN